MLKLAGRLAAHYERHHPFYDTLIVLSPGIALLGYILLAALLKGVFIWPTT